MLAEREGIEVYFWQFNGGVRGIYWRPQGGAPPAIFLDASLQEFPSLLRCVMAEELGHHFTTTGNCLCRTYFNYRDRLSVSKAEHRALRWAAKYLIPKDKFVMALQNGIRERWELAEHFEVTEQMVEFRLGLMKCI